MIQIALGLADPQSATFTLTMTMTLKQWQELADNLRQGYVATNLAHAIDEMIRKASAEFSPEEIKGL